MIDWRQVDPAAWKAAVESPRRVTRRRAGLVTIDGVELGDTVPVASGTVRFSGESSEQWAADVTLTDPLWVPRSPDDPFDPRAWLRLRLWWDLHIDKPIETRGITPDLDHPGGWLFTPLSGLVEDLPDHPHGWLMGAGTSLLPDPDYPGGWIIARPIGWASVPVGTFVLHDPDISDDGTLSMQVQGVDVIAEAKRGGYGGQTISVGGLTVSAALDVIFSQVAPRFPRTIGDTDITLPAVYELGARQPFEDWTEIAGMADWTVRADREGTIVCGPASDDATVRATWQEGPDNRMSAIRRQITTSEMVNRVVVVSTSSEVSPPIVAIVEDDDESSPTWVGRGAIWEERVESDAVATQAAADNLARLTFGRLRLPTETVEVRVPPRPDLDYRDVVQIGRRRVGATGAYLVSSWDLDLAGGTSTVRTMARSIA